eukprot:scaffold206280_cov28-Tisochrysis_lutea.AAC.5
MKRDLNALAPRPVTQATNLLSISSTCSRTCPETSDMSSMVRHRRRASSGIRGRIWAWVVSRIAKGGRVEHSEYLELTSSRTGRGVVPLSPECLPYRAAAA